MDEVSQLRVPAKSKILFVDDEQLFLNGLRRMLRHQESVWDMSFVTSADDALKMACDVHYDAIVVDLMMPGTDGFQLLEAFQANESTRDVPAIMLTGMGDRELKRRALDAGAADLLGKPVEPEQLEARIRSALRLKGYQDQLKNSNEALTLAVRERTAELEASRMEVIWHLAKAGEYRDEGTGNHVVRVGYFCRAIAQQMHLSDEFIEMLFVTSPLHDIGKIGIPDGILLKKGSLTLDERAIMERHCRIGAEILLQKPESIRAYSQQSRLLPNTQWVESENKLLNMASIIALSHHERWDGTGYPDGLTAENTPIEARIVAIADVYDALCSVRPYKPAFSEDEALAIVREGSGKHFDPAVYTAFEACRDELRTVRSTLMDDQEPTEEQRVA